MLTDANDVFAWLVLLVADVLTEEQVVKLLDFGLLCEILDLLHKREQFLNV